VDPKFGSGGAAGHALSELNTKVLDIYLFARPRAPGRSVVGLLGGSGAPSNHGSRRMGESDGRVIQNRSPTADSQRHALVAHDLPRLAARSGGAAGKTGRERDCSGQHSPRSNHRIVGSWSLASDDIPHRALGAERFPQAGRLREPDALSGSALRPVVQIPRRRGLQGRRLRP
jgi:hypothetical protein